MELKQHFKFILLCLIYLFIYCETYESFDTLKAFQFNLRKILVSISFFLQNIMSENKVINFS